ncbi:uncharacterized protein BDR25DRAFT_331154 [Lindgomyces ingoldianus]|uniref:Uncharacterized protein n=1 Tax=Lindgomyces ingoldianus TaxID=673940 RepID=A0ACB6RAH2_9PLEO|nr:uncharacterized protein BDR25DRAFT_331154 [Lindgomyces ingoldianus]KAF2476264.1 hypothetical protein BDR25DRAFT_331154 [Lindgomyces ingoldianus]
MAEVQAQPTPNLSVGTTEKEVFITKLDGLLEQYLNTLDQYQRAQQKLTSSLSSGFFSLAQANFNNRSHSRYGQDYYDERMQATRRITVTAEGTHVAFACSAPNSSPSPAESVTDASADGEAPLEKTSESPLAASATASTLPPGVNKASYGDTDTRTDPLHWFGILVPPALRSTQSSFISAVEGPIPQVVTLMKELRKQEVEIARLRKQIKKL